MPSKRGAGGAPKAAGSVAAGAARGSASGRAREVRFIAGAGRRSAGRLWLAMVTCFGAEVFLCGTPSGLADFVGLDALVGADRGTAVGACWGLVVEEPFFFLSLSFSFSARRSAWTGSGTGSAAWAGGAHKVRKSSIVRA